MRFDDFEEGGGTASAVLVIHDRKTHFSGFEEA
jgi:hypothetical protein